MSQRYQSDSSKASVTPYQSFIFIYLTMTGIGFHAALRSVAQATGPDGIWMLPIAGFIIVGLVFLVTKLCGRFPRQTIVQFLPTILDFKRNKKLSRGISLVFIVPLILIWTAVMASQVRVFGEALVSASYPYTPIEVVTLTLLAVTSIAAVSKPGVIAKFNEIIFPITLLPIVVMAIGFFQKGELINIFPLFQIDWMSFLTGLVILGFSFGGFEVIYFYSGYYQRPEKAFMAHSLAIAAVTTFYTSLYVVTLDIFGVAETGKMMWPMLEVVKVMEFPIGILERWESGILAIWMLMVFSSVSNLFVALTGSINNFFQLEDGHNKKIVLGFVIGIYFLANFPANVQEVFLYTDWVSRIYFVFIPLATVFLLLTAWLRKKKGEQSHVSS